MDDADEGRNTLLSHGYHSGLYTEFRPHELSHRANTDTGYLCSFSRVNMITRQSIHAVYPIPFVGCVVYEWLFSGVLSTVYTKDPVKRGEI